MGFLIAGMKELAQIMENSILQLFQKKYAHPLTVGRYINPFSDYFLFIDSLNFL